MFIWTLLIGETLAAGVEEENEHNQYAVAVRKGGIIVGHILYTRELPGPFTTSSDMVAPLNVQTRHRKFGVGLEVPCVYMLSRKPKAINDL